MGPAPVIRSGGMGVRKQRAGVYKCCWIGRRIFTCNSAHNPEQGCDVAGQIQLHARKCNGTGSLVTAEPAESAAQ